MYDKYIVKYVVTTFDKEGQELFERYHTNEETAVKEAKAALELGLRAKIIQHSELTGWEE